MATSFSPEKYKDAGGATWKIDSLSHFPFQLYLLFKNQINSSGSNFYPDQLEK